MGGGRGLLPKPPTGGALCDIGAMITVDRSAMAVHRDDLRDRTGDADAGGRRHRLGARKRIGVWVEILERTIMGMKPQPKCCGSEIRFIDQRSRERVSESLRH